MIYFFIALIVIILIVVFCYYQNNTIDKTEYIILSNDIEGGITLAQ